MKTHEKHAFGFQNRQQQTTKAGPGIEKFVWWLSECACDALSPGLVVDAAARRPQGGSPGRWEFPRAFEQTSERSFERPFEQTFERSLDQTFEQSFEKTIERSVEQPFEQTFERSFEQTFEWSFEQTAPAPVRASRASPSQHHVVYWRRLTTVKCIPRRLMVGRGFVSQRTYGT